MRMCLRFLRWRSLVQRTHHQSCVPLRACVGISSPHLMQYRRCPTFYSAIMAAREIATATLSILSRSVKRLAPMIAS